MKALLYYLVQVIVTSGILYAYYHFALRNKKFHRYNRFYLLAATVISITIPFLNIPVYFTQTETESSFVLQTLTVFSSTGSDAPVSAVVNQSQDTSWFGWQNLSYCFYILIASIALLRIIISLIKIRRITKNNPVEQLDNIHFVNTNEPGTPFSFFRWLFWNRKIELRSEKGEQIFRHELFHIKQKHSWDIMFMELLTVVLWINPFYHLMKKEIKAIHEFLADQFAITENTKWQYAELLLMQALNTNQHLVNPFFHNQIKRRIAMITTSKKASYQYLRKLMVLPVAAIVVALFAFSYKNQRERKQILTTGNGITVVIDAGHGMDATGKPNGTKASDGSYEDDIVLAIAKKIRDLNTNDRVKIILTREDKNFVALTKRMEFANAQQAGLFISLHTNAAPEKYRDKKGIDIYIPDKNKTYYSENRILASILFNYFSQVHAAISIQKKQQGIFVIDNSNCPSALVECGYISNPDDLAFMKDPVGQEKIANSILLSIEQYAMQKESDDWEERKRSVVDTVISPNDRIIKDGIAIKDESGKTVYLPNATIIYKGHDLKDTSADLLVYIDGKLYPELQRISDIDKKIKPADVEMICILKGEKATDKYGEKGKNGVLEIITKKNKNLEEIKKSWLNNTHLADTTKPAGTDNKIFDKVEIEASFPGGDVKWRQYVEYNMGKRNFNLDKTASEGTYTTMVKFIVDKEGNVSDVKPLTAHGYGMEEEAIRIVKNGPKWNPAVQNGQRVNAYRRQPITFVVKKNIVFDKVEIEPSFPGGELKWRQYLERNLDASIPAKKKAPDGAYTVIVQFIVDKEGNISDAKSLTNHGYGMENEALRVIKTGPWWVPAMQNGQKVRAYKKQPITFIVGKGQKNFPSTIKPTGNDVNEVVVATFSQVETAPSFPGGDSAWKKFLMKNANSLVPVDSGAPAGVYKTIIQFIVHEDGSVSDVKALTKHGYGMENEAMRVIKAGPKWIPAKQNGHIVTAYVQQPITFEISGDDGTTETLNGIALPVENARLKIPFGSYNIGALPANNPGITLSSMKGSKVRSMQNGEIVGVFSLDGYKALIIAENNYFTTYSGLENVKLIKGQKVNKGEVLGEVAANRNYELDFIVMKGTKNIDPIPWLINQ